MRQIGDGGGCFSPDGRLVVVQDASRVIRLVETETGRTLARLESPDLCSVGWPTFSPDGSRLVVTTNDGPAVHVWDLRAIRKPLADDGPRLGRAGLFRSRSGCPVGTHPRTSSKSTIFEHLNAEATVLAQEGRWEEAAAAVCSVPYRRGPEYAYLWFENAVLHLAVGDVAGYHSSLPTHARRGPRQRRPRGWMYAAHACVLAADGPAESAQALQLAERRATVLYPAHGPITCWGWPSTAPAGLPRPRPGSWAACAAIPAGNARSWTGWSCPWPSKGSADPTRPDAGWSGPSAGSQIRLRGRPGGVDRAIPENWSWRDGILLHLLLREARALIGAELPMLPEDVFAPAT